MGPTDKSEVGHFLVRIKAVGQQYLFSLDFTADKMNYINADMFDVAPGLRTAFVPRRASSPGTA